MADRLTTAFEGSVDEGTSRAKRSLNALLATGAVGGIDVSVGVFAMFVVLEGSGNEIAASIAFSFGFVAITLANSELFTENFLVPIAAVAAKGARWRDVLRLWAGTAATNLAGGWVMMAVLVVGYPRLRQTALERSDHFFEAGLTTHSFATAILAGVVITLMTWMERGSPAVGGKLVAAIGAGFLLSYGQLNHAVVASIEMFSGLLYGTPHSYLEWLQLFLWAAAGNLVGGIGLVTVLRLVQVGPVKLREERARDDEERDNDRHEDKHVQGDSGSVEEESGGEEDDGEGDDDDAGGGGDAQSDASSVT